MSPARGRSISRIWARRAKQVVSCRYRRMLQPAQDRSWFHSRARDPADRCSSRSAWRAMPRSSSCRAGSDYLAVARRRVLRRQAGSPVRRRALDRLSSDADLGVGAGRGCAGLSERAARSIVGVDDGVRVGRKVYCSRGCSCFAVSTLLEPRRSSRRVPPSGGRG